MRSYPKCQCGVVVGLYFSQRLNAWICPPCLERDAQAAMRERCAKVVRGKCETCNGTGTAMMAPHGSACSGCTPAIRAIRTLEIE